MKPKKNEKLVIQKKNNDNIGTNQIFETKYDDIIIDVVKICIQFEDNNNNKNNKENII